MTDDSIAQWTRRLELLGSWKPHREVSTPVGAICYLLEIQPLKSVFSPKFGHVNCIGRVTSSLQGSLSQYSHIEKCLSLSYLKPRSGSYIQEESLFPSFFIFNHYETLSKSNLLTSQVCSANCLFYTICATKYYVFHMYEFCSKMIYY